MMRESEQAGALHEAPDVASLADSPRLDPKALGAALEPLPGRRALVGPFHYAWLTHGVLTTQGGAAIDPTGRVLRTTAPHPRPAGRRRRRRRLAGKHSGGYSSGNGLLSAFGMGWIVGNDIARAGVAA